MEERHWWFASKLQETFHFGGYDNPTLLEDFLSEPDVVDLINKFLSPGQPRKLFFYCDAAPPSSHSSPVPPQSHGEFQASPDASRRLHVVSQLTKDVLAQGCVCLYVLRTNVEVEVDVSMMERELYCGELRHSVLSSLATLLAEAYGPILHTQKNWQECSDETVIIFLQNFNKFSNALCDLATKVQVYQPILQRPSQALKSDLIYGQDHLHRGGGGGGGGRGLEDLLGECDALVSDWIGSIQSLLIDTTDERLEDPNGSLLSELSKWQRRQTLICSVVEQLKSKECKSVLAALVTSKSRLVKKWRSIDIQITDAFNNARDRVRYLEVLSPHLEILEAASPPSPAQVISTILPSLMATIKQMENISRVYARSGYLGILLTKLSNALVRACVSNLDSYCCTSADSPQGSWALLFKAIQFKAKSPTSDSDKDPPPRENVLISKLESFLLLSIAFKDFLIQLKDSLQTQHVSFSHSQSKRGSATPSTNPKKSSLPIKNEESLSVINPSGIPLHNADVIMSGMTDFISRVSKILEVISTLGQFTQLISEKKIGGLPRFAGLWQLELPDGKDDERNECDFMSQSFNYSDMGSVKAGTTLIDGMGSTSDITLATPDYLDMLMGKNVQSQQYGQQEEEEEHLEAPTALSGFHSRGLSILKEEDSFVGSEEGGGGETVNHTPLREEALPGDAGTASTASTATASTTISHHQRQITFSSSDNPADSLGVMVQVGIKTIKVQLQLDCGGGIVEILGAARGKGSAAFTKAYKEFTLHVAQLDTNICYYLKAVFSKVMSSSKALDILTKLSPISSRPAIKEVMERCMLVSFNKYGQELEGIQLQYEKSKGQPTVSRNAPPVVEAVQWARQLLRQVEQPMAAFKNSKPIMQSVESMHICKLYNRLATALLKYETLWLNRWKSLVEGGRGGLKTPLLIQEKNDSGDTVIRVNSNKEMLELLAESKALARLGVPLPQAAQTVLSQELRIKEFKQQLELVLGDYYSVKSSIDPSIQSLMTPHLEVVLRSLLPGWTTLTWNTMNIDAFLHHVQSCIKTLEVMATRVSSILKEKVYGTITLITEMTLFDVGLATSRTWHPQQFVEIVSSSIIERSNKLMNLISIIHAGLHDIITITTPQSHYEQSTDLYPLLSIPIKARHRGQDESTSNTPDKHRFKNSDTSSTPEYTASRITSGQHTCSVRTLVTSSNTPIHDDTAAQLDSAGEAVLLHFCELVFDEVSKMVLRSHELFNSCLWSKTNNECSSSMVMDEGAEQSKRGNRVVSFNLPDSPEKVDSLAEVLKQDGGEVQTKLSNLLSSLYSSLSQRDHVTLQLVVDINFAIPRVVLEPSLDEVYTQLVDVSNTLLGVLRKTRWWLGPSAGKQLYDMLELNGVIESMQNGILQAIQGISPSIEDCLQSLRQYDFLWQRDLHSSYQLFLSSQPQLEDCSSYIQNFLDLEEKVEAIPFIFTAGPLQLSAKPVKNSLKALAVSWKMEYSAFIHQQAKSSLDSLVSEREGMVTQLQAPVEDLSQLRDTLQLLHHITDLQSVVDDMYLPVEKQYALLREFNPHLARDEIQMVDSLRDQWTALTELAEKVRMRLLSEQRLLFEREVDKQVKRFVVETIQFRNSFDTEGPLVPGLFPNEAVTRLGTFLDHCEDLKCRRDLLDSVQKLLSIPPTPYPELDQTERDLSYLGALYKNYQHFITFDKKFRQELWNEVDLDSAEQEVESFWLAYESLPVEQQEWDASRKLRTEITQYREILPLLKQLHSREIRNRHWLQVMGVANCTFQLEGSIFKMAHLLDAGLLLHVAAIQGIVSCAQLELQLEEKFFSIEGKWTEETLHFKQYKSHGPALLDKDHTHSLLEQLEHAQIELATMLVSRHIQPLREEAIHWAAKLASVSDILQQWLFVQKLWHNLEAVFNTPRTAQEFLEEAVKFASIHKRWIKLMKKAHETKNIFQCCFSSGETAHSLMLSGIRQELEECKKSLSTYLQSKREAFPRFFYVSDDSLLSILSNPTSVTSIQPHLLSLFGSTNNILLADTSLVEDTPIITAVESIEGEQLNLAIPVPLVSGVEVWAGRILSSVHSTLRQLITSPVCIAGDGSSLPLEEVAHSQVLQVATMALFFQWCKECEHALLQCRYDRRALPGARAKFSMWGLNKLVTLLMKNSWKVVDEVLSPLKRMNLEALAMFSLWLRDILDDLCHHKLRDIGDFEWQRAIRPYLKEVDLNSTGTLTYQGDDPSSKEEEIRPENTVVLQCLDNQIEYGFEYLGCASIPVFTSRANNYIIAFTQSHSRHLASFVTGPTGSGKVRLIKGIGQISGRNVLTLHCSPLMSGAPLLRVFEGLVQEGSWACFSDVDHLPTSSFSVLSQMMHIISTTLQSKKASCTFPSTNEVTLQPGLALFLTYTSIPSSPQWTPPPSILPLIRTFSFPLPDSTVVVRAYATSLGLKAPKALANKLITLQRMAREQLSTNCPQANLSTPSICHILKVANHLITLSKGATASQTAKNRLEHRSSSLFHENRLLSTSSGPSPAHEPKGKGSKGSTLSVFMSPAAGQPLPPPVMKEHAFIAQLVLKIIGARLPSQELNLFTTVVKRVFAGSPEMPNIQIQHLISPAGFNMVYKNPSLTITSHQNISEQLKEEASKAGLVPSKPWLSKVEHLFAMTHLKHAVIIAGRPATGKTAALNTVISALNANPDNSATIKLMRLFPKAMDDISDVFGCVNLNTGDWEDGIFTSIFRKAHKATQSVMWLCMDGPMDTSWVQYIPELLGKGRTLTLSNGEHLLMNDSSLKLIFETGDLDQASPSSVLNTGIVYFDANVLGWRPVVQAWLAGRNPREAKCLLKYFEQIMDSVVEFVMHKLGQTKMYSEVGLIETCLAYLSTLLNNYNETAEVFSEIHIERLLLFGVIWSYGGILVGEKEQMRFSQLLKTLTNSLPDDDSQYSVFDYYVDESGEWDVWQSKIPLDPELQVDMLGSVFVDTVETIRVEVLLELALVARRHTLLVGPHGCGKTTVSKHFLQSRALSFGSSEVLKQLVLDGYTKSDAVQNFMGVNFHHRQGYTYGPKHGKLLECFIDDLHLPLRSNSNASSCSSYEYLRQLSDVQGLYNLKKKNEWCLVEDFMLLGCLTSNSDALVSPRFRRHLAVIHLSSLGDESLKAIVSQQLQGLLEAHSHELNSKSVQGILEASIELYSSVKETLKVSNAPGRNHYFFSLKNLVSLFQGLCQCISSGLLNKLDCCWKQEAKRAFIDGLCRVTDHAWMQTYIESLCLSKITPECGPVDDEELVPNSSSDRFIITGISPEVKQGDEQPSSSPAPLSTLPESNLVCLKQWSDLYFSMAHYLRRYREEYGETFELEISDNNLCCLVKLHRALKFSMGNSILVGSLGEQLNSLASFSFFLAGYDMQSLDCSREGSFRDGMKSLFRQAGMEGKPIGVVIKESDLDNLEILQALNNIITSREYPTLFSNDELEGILQALHPSIKRDFPSQETDPMQYFIARLFRNLRFIFCLPPTSPLLGEQAHDFKGLLQSSHVIWFSDWTSEALLNSTSHCFANSPLATELDEEIRLPLMKCLSSIHSFMMQETQQLVHLGLQANHFVQDSCLIEESSTDCNRPSTYDILVEKMAKMNESNKKGGVAFPYVGPRTHLQFLECFCEIYSVKRAQVMTDRANLGKALAALHSTQDQAEEMKRTLEELRHKHSQASKLADELLKSLTLKSCELEKLRALLGYSSSVLSAIQMVNEQERQLLENDEDDEELLSLFMGRQTTRLEAMLVKAKERLKVAEQEASEAEQTMIKSKERALYWHGKIDRNAIDQIKNLNNPPPLVGIIMELILTLLQQYGVDQLSSSESEGSSFSTPGHNGQSSRKKKKSTYSDKEQWNAIQIAIGDSQKFLDLLNGLKWEDGLSTDAVNLILSKLAIPGKNVPLSESEAKPGTGSALERSLSFSASKGTPENLITVSMARHAAESAAHMCAFAVSIVEYNDSFKPYKLATEKLQLAQQELAELESSLQNDSTGSLKFQEASIHKTEAPNLEDVSEEAEAGEEGLQRLQEEVDELQEKFDKAVIEKHSLAQTCQQLSEKLKSANHLLERLKGQQEAWQKKLDALPQIKMLIANCILTAAITVYCGPLKTCIRHKFFENLLRVCKSQGFPAAGEDLNNVLKIAAYPEFMLGVPALHQLVIEDLPPDSTSQQNAAIITYPHSRTWPLVLDPLKIAEQWMKKREEKALTIRYQDPNMSEALLNAMEQGLTVLITNTSMVQLDKDTMLLDILQCRRLLHRSKNVVKLLIGDKEVECNPDFKLCLLSPDPPSAVSPQITSLVCTVFFHPEIQGMQESILDAFLQLQNQKTFQEREQLRAEIYSQSVKLEKAGKELLEIIVEQDGSHVEEPRATKTILQLNSSYEDAMESLTKAEARYSLMNKVHLSVLRSLASQAGVIMATVSAMGSILPAYQTSYMAMLSVFLTFIELTGSRIQGEDSLMKMTRTAYSYFMKGYFEKDRLLFSFMLSEEIEISLNRGTREEQAFLISPTPGHQFIVKGLITQNSQTLDTGTGQNIQFGKKPFDWMADSQWQMLLMLASRFSWIHPILERLGKDGKDAAWRTIGEGAAPEAINLTESVGCKLLPLQQLLILFAMRPERTTQCIESFISSVLDPGQKQKRILTPVDISRMAKNIKSDEVPLILFRDDPHIPVTKLQKYASKLQVPLTICYLHGSGKEEIDSTLKALQLASSQGHWILLHNIQSSPDLFAQLPSLLEFLPAREKWRIWLSVQGDCFTIPHSLLHSANRIVLDPPCSLRSSVLYSLSNLAGDVVSSSSRVEWLPILHCMAMLHATVRLRKEIYAHAWLTNLQWTHSHFMDCIEYMRKDFINTEKTAYGTSGLKPVSWGGVRYMIAEIFYGAVITDRTSASIFNALTEHWIHNGGPKKEAGRYHMPSVFFTPGTKLNALLQAVENAFPPLVLSAEICGLYYSPIIKLGWTNYLFPKLSALSNLLQEFLPLHTFSSSNNPPSNNAISISSATKSNKTQQRSIHLLHNPAPVLLERLPSFITVASQLTEVNLSHVPPQLLSLVVSNPSLIKELPLKANIEKLMVKIPSVWKKEVILERLKKHGVDSPFTIFMKSEVSRMTECLQCIHNDLRELFNCTSESSSGDKFVDSPHLVTLAVPLLTFTVPKPWLDLVGPTAPPPDSWLLKEWLQDLVLRFTFLDRVLVGGLPKTATYWLGAFFNPAAFLNIIQQATVRMACNKSGAVEQFVFKAELTNRDKDHVRDPPNEGELFVYGAYLWGCGFEKNMNTDFQDIPPKQVPVLLPVLHLTASLSRNPVTDSSPQTSTFATDHKGPHIFNCPCFASNRASRRERNGGDRQILFTVTLTNSDITPAKWTTRNLVCTLRPF